MGRNGSDYSQGKRQREQKQLRKQQDKAERRRLRRDQGASGPEIVSAASVIGALPSTEEAMRAIELRAAAPRAAATIPCRLFVGGLGQVITEAQLREAFGAFGPIADAIVMTDRATGQSRGFGFVTMADRKDGLRAIEALNGSELHGCRIVTNVAVDRQR